MLLPCFFLPYAKQVGQLHFRACALTTNNTTLLINYINLAAKEKVWELLFEKVPAYKHAHLWQIQKYSHGKARKSLPSMGKYLKGGGRGEACSVKRTTDKSAKPNTCNRWLGQQTRAVYFATLLRNEMESDVVRFTIRVAIN